MVRTKLGEGAYHRSLSGRQRRGLADRRARRHTAVTAIRRAGRSLDLHWAAGPGAAEINGVVAAVSRPVRARPVNDAQAAELYRIRCRGVWRPPAGY